MKINKTKILGIVADVLLALIFLSGWVLYIWSSIARDNEEARLLNEESKTIMDSLPAMREVTTIKIKDTSSAYYLDYINRLIDENDSIRDSLIYYSMYHDLASRKLDMDFIFEKKKIKDGYDYTGYLKSRNKSKSDDSVLDTRSLINTDTLTSE